MQRLRAGALLVALLACAGCERDSTAGDPPRAPAPTSFALADFLKPRMDGPVGIDPYLAPLFYLEAPHGAPLGFALVNGEGRLEIDAGQPTVYYARNLVQLEEHEREQLTFVWFRDATPVRAQGIRLTLDRDGYPVITEVLTDSSGRRVVYVADELEGGVSALEEEVEILPAGPFGSAPAPSGPYVYQARDANDIATIHCRCSPTQADETREMIEYELVPLEGLEGVWPPEGELGFAAPGAPAPGLRLPSGF